MYFYVKLVRIKSQFQRVSHALLTYSWNGIEGQLNGY